MTCFGPKNTTTRPLVRGTVPSHKSPIAAPKNNAITVEGGINTNKAIVEVDKLYFRPLDVNTLLGNALKARKKLKWKPKINLNSLIEEMVEEEEKIINENR